MMETPAGSMLEEGGQAEEGHSNIGCALTILAVNTLVIGLLAASFAQGPYSSWGQELWYRYGSLGFLLGGAILPAIALLFRAGRSRWATIFLTVWMLGLLFACFAYALRSGGGV